MAFDILRRSPVCHGAREDSCYFHIAVGYTINNHMRMHQERAQAVGDVVSRPSRKRIVPQPLGCLSDIAKQIVRDFGRCHSCEIFPNIDEIAVSLGSPN
jgi:hypothetical protein